MIDDILSKLDELSNELHKFRLIFDSESENEVPDSRPSLLVSTNASRLLWWKAKGRIPSIEGIEEIEHTEKIVQKGTEISEYFERILKSNDNLAIDLLMKGYPSVDTEGVFPTYEIIANQYAKNGTYNLQTDVLKLKDYLSHSRLIALDILLKVVQQILHDDEELRYIEYGITCMSEVIDKYKMPGLFLTNKRLILVGNDLPHDRNPFRPSSASITIAPGVTTSIALDGSPKYAKLYYPSTENHESLGSVDYIWLDQIDKVKEKKGVFSLILKKDFRVLSLPESMTKNRPVIISVKDPKLIKPLRKREIEIRLAHDREISETTNKDKSSMFKSILEKAMKEA